MSESAEKELDRVEPFGADKLDDDVFILSHSLSLSLTHSLSCVLSTRAISCVSFGLWSRCVPMRIGIL